MPFGRWTSPNTLQLVPHGCSLMLHLVLRKLESDRLSDLVSVGVLMRAFPPGLVDEVMAQIGRTERLHRTLPARVMA